MKIQMNITIWNGNRNTSSIGRTISALHHARVRVLLISRPDGIMNQFIWTSSTIFNPYSFPLSNYVDFRTDANINTISSGLGKNPIGTWALDRSYPGQQNQAVVDFQALQNEAAVMSIPSQSYGTSGSQRKSLGDHSVEGCFYLAAKLIVGGGKFYGDLNRWKVSESQLKIRQGQRVNLADLIGTNAANNYGYADTFEYDAMSLINSLQSMGFT